MIVPVLLWQSQKHREYRQKIIENYQVCNNQIFIFFTVYLAVLFFCLKLMLNLKELFQQDFEKKRECVSHKVNS